VKEPTVDAGRAAEILAATATDATEEPEEPETPSGEELPGRDEESEPDESESRPTT
jgi:hypothetical protein